MTKRWLVVLALLGATTPVAADSRRPQVRRPGFEMTADGGSRLFVALSGKPTVEERRAEKTITYVLKQTNLRASNSTRALVTEYFNTPVQRARLVRKGADLHFVVDLRAASEPTWKLVERENGTADLQIDFAAGTFVTAEAIPTPSRRLADPEDPAAEGAGMWSTASDVSEPTTSVRRTKRGNAPPASGLRDKAEQLRVKADPEATKRWQDAKKAQPRSTPGQGPTEEQLRALREKKQAERDAMHRSQQELDRRGGAGTAVSHD